MKAQQLVQQLKAVGKPIREGFFVVAGYDPVRFADEMHVPGSLPGQLVPCRSALKRMATVDLSATLSSRLGIAFAGTKFARVLPDTHSCANRRSRMLTHGHAACSLIA